MTLTQAQYRSGLVALILCGAALRLFGLNWDQGRGLHPDEGNLVRAALTLGVDGRLIPEFHAYNDLALWLPRIVSRPFCNTGDAACLTIAARFLSAVMAVAAIPLAAALARRLAGDVSARAAGLAGAALFAGAAPLVQWAHFGTTESALILVVLVLWLLAVRWLDAEIGTREMALCSGAVIGLGFGLKTAALSGAFIPLAAFVMAGKPDAARVRALGLGAGVAVGVGLACAPSVWAATREWLDVMAFESDVVTGRLPVHWTEQFHAAVPGLFELRQLWSASTGAGLLLAVLGVVLLPRDRRRLAAPALVFALIYGVIIVGWQARFFRYLAPLFPVLLVLAAVAVGRLAQPLRSRFALALALAGGGAMMMAGMDQAAIYLRTDPRIAAETVLSARASPQDAVAIEPHDLAQTGKQPRLYLPLSERDVTPEALAEVLSQVEWVMIASRRNWAVRPQYPQSPRVLCGYYAALASGDLGFVRVAAFDRRGPFGRLFAPTLAAEETRRVFDRPEVYLLQNQARLGAKELAQRISAASDPAACHAEALAAGWRRVP
ncbi:hypothetical protein N4R57_18145 [Rhodobacteraceae bacterium D3-12]|nr:hypothetical protein N4R57_18145 [Rhodobacteraceae bacterium D3-12]